MTIPKNSKRSGGPRTAEGKRAVAGNAVKHGATAVLWWDPDEEAQYEAVLGALLEEFPGPSASAQMLIERLATNYVRLGRLESIDNAQQQLARLQAEEVNALLEQPSAEAHGVSAPAPAMLALRRAAALPSPERMNSLERHRMNLERQVITLVSRIRLLYRPRSPVVARRAAGGEAAEVAAIVYEAPRN